MVSKAEYKTILIGIVFGLLVGAGAGYIYGQSPIPEYKEEVDGLESENLELQSQQEQLKEDYKDLQDQLDNITATLYSTQCSLKDLQKELGESLANYDALQLSYEELEGDFKELNLTHMGLLNTLEIQALKNYSREIPFELDAGYQGNAHKTCTFDIGYGILMDVDIDFTSNGEYGSKASIDISWRRGEDRGYLGGLVNAPSESARVVHGVAYCEIFDEGEDCMWVKAGAQLTEFSWIKREASTVFRTKT